MDRLRPELVALARAGHDVILAEDLRRLRFDSAERAAAVRLLHPLRRGAYALVAPQDDENGHLLTLRAALRQADSSAAASHISAALAHGLPVPAGTLATVHMCTDSPTTRVGLRHGVHTHARSGSATLTMVEGLPVTDVATTVFDCARMLPFVDAVALLDTALNRELLDQASVIDNWAKAPGLPGIATARRVAAMADAGAGSVGETRMRLILVQAGFEVESQVELLDKRGRFVARVDLKLRDAPVVVEFDGRAKYNLRGDPEAAHWEDKIRHDRIGNLGYERVRVWWNRLADPASIVRDVEQARDRTRKGRKPQSGADSRQAQASAPEPTDHA